MSTPDPEETEREALAKALYVAKRKRITPAGTLTWEQEPGWKREEFLVVADDALSALAARRLSESGGVDLDAIRARIGNLITRLREEAYYISTPEPAARILNEVADTLDEVERLRLSESEIRRDQAEKDAGIALALDQSVGGVGQWYDGHSAGVNDAAEDIRAQFTPSPETEQENTR